MSNNTSFNPIVFIKNLVTLNPFSKGVKQEFVQHSSTVYPTGQTDKGVDVVSIKTLAPPSRVGNNVDVRV